MNQIKPEPARTRRWMSVDDCDLSAFRQLVEREAKFTDYPYAAAIDKNIVIYDADALVAASATEEGRNAVLCEICDVFDTGPGVAVFRNAMPDTGMIDRASAIFSEIIDAQRSSSKAAGDHFGKPGANDRIWNSLEKHCLADPENFAHYYANPVIELASTAWLGPYYQMTAQVNRVNPGGAAQTPHRDYHLGFQTPQSLARFPSHVHRLSPVLTLQGAVAHCDMPLESGPTLFLPFSQMYEPGYIATALPDFQDYFQRNHVQLPLKKGDIVFFNPALFHAAGTNRSENILRVANLLQVSSAFGRAMETVDRVRMARVLYPVLKQMREASRLTENELHRVIAASAEGYSFPTNLDLDPPIGGIAPKTQAQLMLDALDQGMELLAFAEALTQQSAKRLS
jgi:ectoine hydroxylase-related dioxygenase (phytanoyl-CoA dioxygenase family)